MNFDEMPQRFDFDNAGRMVPLSVRLNMLLGGFLNQFGWLFFGFGLIFVWIFVPYADLTSWYVFSGPLEETKGTVLASEPTGFAVGRGKGASVSFSGKNKRRGPGQIYAHRYEFVAADGVTRTGTSYARSSDELVGRDVTIEHPAGDPEHSRIQKMTAGILPPMVLFVLIFPLVGMGIMLVGLVPAWKGLRLLTHGRLASAEKTGSERTNWKVNHQTVEKLHFSFDADDGLTYKKTVSTALPKLRQCRNATIVYYPGNPQYAELLDRLPAHPEIDRQGNVSVPHPGRGYLFLILPAIVTLGHGTYLISCLVTG